MVRDNGASSICADHRRGPSFVSAAWRISATVCVREPPWRSVMITMGVTPSTRRIALVERLAPSATLEPTMTARVADEAPMSHDRDTVFSMM
jgi:hypothetical protein